MSMIQDFKYLTTVKEYEREKIYRISRRIDALNNLLQTVENTKISFDNLPELKLKINNDILMCQERQKKWWQIICKKYSLPEVKDIKVQVYTGEIYGI